MQWTRRGFIGAAAGAAGALGLGGVVAGSRLEGKAFFDDWRALPGMKMALHLEVENPEETSVTFVARADGNERGLGRMDGASLVEFRVPHIETNAESYELYAIIEDRQGRKCESETLEVLSGRYQFGM